MKCILIDVLNNTVEIHDVYLDGEWEWGVQVGTK
jgi:hypothetical protein